jgi:hypothetical protein
MDVQGQPQKRRKTQSQNKVKRAQDDNSVGGCLPNMCKALGSISRKTLTQRKKKKKGRKKEKEKNSTKIRVNTVSVLNVSIQKKSVT